MSAEAFAARIDGSRRASTRVALRVLLIVVLLAALCCAAVAAWVFWAIVRPIDQFDRSIQDAWRPFNNWELLDAAMRADLASEANANDRPLPVPLSQQIEFHQSDGSRLRIVYGGGFHHCGIIYYRDRRQLEAALMHDAGSDGVGDTDTRRLNDKLLFFSEK